MDNITLKGFKWMKNMKKILKIIYESNKKKSNLSGKITMI